MTEPRRRVDQEEASFPLDSELRCNSCGQPAGELHKHDCPKNSHEVIAAVNGEPALVRFRHNGRYRAPNGLSAIAEYLEADGGVHDELGRLRDRLLEKESKRKKAVEARVQAEDALEGCEETAEHMATALQDCADLLRYDSYTHRDRVNLADNIESYLLKDASGDERIVPPELEPQ